MLRKVVLLSVCWVLLLAPAAFAGAYNTPSLDYEPLGNNQLRIFGTGCQANEVVTIQFDDRTVQTTADDDSGSFSVVIDVTGLSGDLTVTATCGDLVQSLVISLGTTTPLPRTGDNSSLPLARAGAVLLAAGGAALYLSQKRTRSKRASVAA